MNKATNLVIFGDICPVADTLSGFYSGKPENLMSADIVHLVRDADFSIGNLECVLTDDPKPIRKTGPILHAPVKCIDALAKTGFKAFSLANNHIRDCGTAGLRSTIEACQSQNISTFGAGLTIHDAKAPLIKEINGHRIAFLSFSEHEFNYVTDSRGGAATFDVYSDLHRIKDLKDQVDLLIVLYHGGIEYNPYPSPMLQKKCRMIAQAGANIILCQHSHCIGTYEYFQNSFILYGQGNNIFGFRANSKSWNEGLIAQILIQEKNFEVKLIPCITTSQSKLSLFDKPESQNVLETIKRRSEQISHIDFIESEWAKFCANAEDLNLALLLGWNRYLIFMNRMLKGWPLKLIYGRNKRNITHNLIRCESHYEVMRTILERSDFE